MQGRLEEAREQLDEALDLSLAIRIIRNVTLCLAAFAQLAFAEGDPERAALLAGGAEGLRRRDQFGRVFAAGSAQPAGGGGRHQRPAR